MRNRLIETEIAELFKDIYIGTKEDIKASFTKNSVKYISFTYRSTQGEFLLTLPETNCYLFEDDTTVENIAKHLAELFSQKYPNDHIEIQSFEGVKKGAIAK